MSASSKYSNECGNASDRLLVDRARIQLRHRRLLILDPFYRRFAVRRSFTPLEAGAAAPPLASDVMAARAVLAIWLSTCAMASARDAEEARRIASSSAITMIEGGPVRPKICGTIP